MRYNMALFLTMSLMAVSFCWAPTTYQQNQADQTPTTIGQADFSQEQPSINSPQASDIFEVKQGDSVRFQDPQPKPQNSAIFGPSSTDYNQRPSSIQFAQKRNPNTRQPVDSSILGNLFIANGQVQQNWKPAAAPASINPNSISGNTQIQQKMSTDNWKKSMKIDKNIVQKVLGNIFASPQKENQPTVTKVTNLFATTQDESEPAKSEESISLEETEDLQRTLVWSQTGKHLSSSNLQSISAPKQPEPQIQKSKVRDDSSTHLSRKQRKNYFVIGIFIIGAILMLAVKIIKMKENESNSFNRSGVSVPAEEVEL